MFREGAFVDPKTLDKIFRWTQMILCAICSACALYMFISLRYLVLIAVVTAMVVSFAFLLICVVDIFSMYVFLPISWASWILLSTVAAMFFLLCCGLILAQLVMAGFLFGITGIVFLMNAIFLIWLSKSDKKIETIPKDTKPKRRSITTDNKNNNETTFFVQQQEIACLEIAVQCGPDQCPRFYEETETVSSKRKVVKRPPNIREQPKRAPSYGGTFHVSKDVAPLYSSESPRRTVAITTRTVPKTPPAPPTNETGTYTPHICVNPYCPNKSTECNKLGCPCCHPYGHYYQHANQASVQSAYSTPIQRASPQSSIKSGATPKSDTNAILTQRNDVNVQSDDFIGRQQMYIKPIIPNDCPCKNCVATRLAISLVSDEGDDNTLLPGEADRTSLESKASIGQQCQIAEKSSYQPDPAVIQKATIIDMGETKEPISHLVPVYFRKRQKKDEETATEKSRNCHIQ